MIDLWMKFSPRERALGIACLVLIVLGAFGLAGVKAKTSLEELDARIERLQDQLLQYKRLEMRSQSIEAAFAEVEEQHSSEWTEVEIHDRLRREIYRLALKRPFPAGARPETASVSRSDYLVDIPRLNPGTLLDGGEGYREYQINFTVPPTSIDNIVLFLERLQQSPQLLHITSLELMRPPQSTEVAANIEVKRTVVDSSPEKLRAAQARPDDIARNGSFEEWDAAARSFDEWETQDCRVFSAENYVTEGERCMKAVADSPGATIYQNQELKPGTTYVLTFDAAATGPALLRISQNDAGSVDGEQELKANGRVYSYRILFNTPQEASAGIRAPEILLTEKDAAVFVDNVVLRERIE